MSALQRRARRPLSGAPSPARVTEKGGKRKVGAGKQNVRIAHLKRSLRRIAEADARRLVAIDASGKLGDATNRRQAVGTN